MRNVLRLAMLGVVCSFTVLSGCLMGNDPIAITLLGTTINTATIGWDEPHAETSDGSWIPGTFYDVRYSDVMDLPFEQMTAASAVPTPTGTRGAPVQMDITGLVPGTTYQIMMRGYANDPADGTQYQADSNRIEATTAADATPPDAITDLVAQAASDSQVLLTWTSAGDDGIIGSGMQYEVRYSAAPITNDLEFAAGSLAFPPPDPLIAGTSQTFLVGGLWELTTYYFAIKTIDDGGNPSPLSTLSPSATTTAAPPKEKGRNACGQSAASGQPILLALAALGLLVVMVRR